MKIYYYVSTINFHDNSFTSLGKGFNGLHNTHYISTYSVYRHAWYIAIHSRMPYGYFLLDTVAVGTPDTLGATNLVYHKFSQTFD